MSDIEEISNTKRTRGKGNGKEVTTVKEEVKEITKIEGTFELKFRQRSTVLIFNY